MANEYLIEIHNFIGKKILRAQKAKDDATANRESELRRFHEGQLEEWHRLRAYLADRVDLKTQKYF